MKPRIPVLFAASLAAACASGPVQASSQQATQAVLSAHPELSARLARDLPPSTLETAARADGGWSVAVLTWGSGRPGILAAECFAVTAAGEVRPAGQFRNSDLGREVRRVDLATCTDAAG